jgi:hypothetical protein
MPQWPEAPEASKRWARFTNFVSARRQLNAAFRLERWGGSEAWLWPRASATRVAGGKGAGRNLRLNRLRAGVIVGVSHEPVAHGQ